MSFLGEANNLYVGFMKFLFVKLTFGVREAYKSLLNHIGHNKGLSYSHGDFIFFA